MTSEPEAISAAVSIQNTLSMLNLVDIQRASGTQQAVIKLLESADNATVVAAAEPADAAGDDVNVENPVESNSIMEEETIETDVASSLAATLKKNAAAFVMAWTALKGTLPFTKSWCAPNLN
eukprot:6181155-Pleurochrysis_carterae.AAC.3